MENSGNRGRRRPIVENGVLRWVAPDDPRVGYGYIPFGGRGRSLSTPPPSTPLPSGPLSQENINFLRTLAERHPNPRYVGLRHTTGDLDRMRSALTGSVDLPGFHGDAYGMVPELNRRLRALFQGRLPNQGFSGDDASFNRAVGGGIQNSIEWDIAHTPSRLTTVGGVAQHLGENTQFAMADMGGAPRSDEHDRYGSSTQKFGKRTVKPENVFAEVGAEPQQLQRAARQRSLSLSAPVGSHNVGTLTQALAPVYGQGINRALDRERRLEALRNESPEQRRNRVAAAAELRLLQAQGRGQPSVRQRHQTRIGELQQIVRRPPQ